MISFSRHWAMPNADTFSIGPIHNFVWRYLAAGGISIDPFARNKTWCTRTNDLNPETSAQDHVDAEEWLHGLDLIGSVDLALFDPPYSPRQISECYAMVGRKASMRDTQSGWYTRVRNALHPLVKQGGIVLSFGWNSNGMGKTRGYELIEQMNVAHGGAHNDTICIAERKLGA